VVFFKKAQHVCPIISVQAVEAFAGVAHRDDSLGDVAQVQVEFAVFVAEAVAADNRLQKFNFFALLFALSELNV